MSRIYVQKGHIWELNCIAWDLINFRAIHHWKDISVSFPMNFTNINLELSTIRYDQLSADCSVLSIFLTLIKWAEFLELPTTTAAGAAARQFGNPLWWSEIVFVSKVLYDDGGGHICFCFRFLFLRLLKKNDSKEMHCLKRNQTSFCKFCFYLCQNISNWND